MAKKTRSKKQRANDKRLGRMARARAKNPRKKKSRARAKNPRKKTRKAASAPKRTRARAKNPRKKKSKSRSRARARASNPKKGTRRRRRRRSNPGTWENLGVIVKGLGIAFLSAVGSSWLNDGPFGRQRPFVQNIVLVAEALAAAYWIENPVYATASVIGVGLTSLCNVAYRAMPGMLRPPRQVALPGPKAAPGAAPGTTTDGTVVAGPPSSMPAPAMGALHRKQRHAIRALRALDTRMSGLHANASMGTLHRNMAALHTGRKMRALHVGALHIGALHRMGAFNDVYPQAGVYEETYDDRGVWAERYQ
jgi:hypothetical protein